MFLRFKLNHSVFVVLVLVPGCSRTLLRSWLKISTEAVSALTQGVRILETSQHEKLTLVLELFRLGLWCKHHHIKVEPCLQ